MMLHSGFSVNLTLGPGVDDKRSDTALYFNPRFSEKCVVRTSYQNKTWGVEERGNGMPFKIDFPFLIQMSTDLYYYQVSQNRNPMGFQAKYIHYTRPRTQTVTK